LFSVLGHGRGAAMAEPLVNMLTAAGFARTEVVPTRNTNFIFIRAS